VTQYLLDDGTVVLPSLTPREREAEAALAADGWDTGSVAPLPVHNNVDVVFVLTCCAQAFPEFSALVKTTIQELGGRVFPKLNWSAPRVRAVCFLRCAGVLIFGHTGCCVDCHNRKSVLHIG
jgi:hypothetical protein